MQGEEVVWHHFRTAGKVKRKLLATNEGCSRGPEHSCFCASPTFLVGLPRWLGGKEYTCSVGDEPSFPASPRDTSALPATQAQPSFLDFLHPPPARDPALPWINPRVQTERPPVQPTVDPHRTRNGMQVCLQKLGFPLLPSCVSSEGSKACRAGGNSD